MMTTQVLLLVVLFGTMAVGASLGVLNQCPQPTEANPDPPALLYAHTDDCRAYWSCSHGKPRLMQCKPHNRTRYSEYYHTCVGVNTLFDTCTRSNAQRECKRGFTGLIGHPTACHRYYNCSQDPSTGSNPLLEEYEAECRYPQLFDIHEGRCRHFKDVTCGPHRVAAKNPCDYVNTGCTGPTCLPCVKRLPSCDGLVDGFHAFPGKEWSASYIHCGSERLIKKLSCGTHELTGASRVFSPVMKMCVTP